MAELFLKRTLTGFAPDDETAQRYLKALKIGQVVRATVKIPRYGPHHRLVFAMLQLTYKNLPEKYAELWPSFESFRKGIAMAAGHVEEVKTPDGEIHRTPGSISYDALDQAAFEDLAVLMLGICANILQVSEPELAEEVAKHAGIDRWAA